MSDQREIGSRGHAFGVGQCELKNCPIKNSDYYFNRQVPGLAYHFAQDSRQKPMSGARWTGYKPVLQVRWAIG